MEERMGTSAKGNCVGATGNAFLHFLLATVSCVAVQEHKVGHYKKRTLSFSIYTQSGNLDLSSSTANQ